MRPPPLEQIRTPAGGLHPVPVHMGQRQLAHFPEHLDAFGRPVPEARTEPVRHRISPQVPDHLRACRVREPPSPRRGENTRPEPSADAWAARGTASALSERETRCARPVSSVPPETATPPPRGPPPTAPPRRGTEPRGRERRPGGAVAIDDRAGHRVPLAAHACSMPFPQGSLAPMARARSDPESGNGAVSGLRTWLAGLTSAVWGDHKLAARDEARANRKPAKRPHVVEVGAAIVAHFALFPCKALSNQAPAK